MTGQRICFHLSHYPLHEEPDQHRPTANGAARDGLRPDKRQQQTTESCGSPILAAVDDLGVAIQVIANGTDMMVVTNSEGRIIYANQVFLTRLRYSPEELTGKNFSGILSKNNHSKLCEFCQLNRS